ncbi:uncharacterized protein LOC117573590 [Drosophila albomicans]|uniref:Uncharacterized protein LOC117573590 n=1 Tax=Drosophila albomicans TaxID=7291 RepID=A0A6P8X9B6_DROAB|nr:uncharacterized protein LOC117573590 [Drosophila albomicans]
MACSCCESAVVNAMDITKSVCVTFKIDLIGLSVDVTISLDGDAVSQFTLDTKSPPSLCLPVISDLTSLTVCLKMTMNLASATSLSICPNFYSNYDANQILAYNFPCINVGMDGIIPNPTLAPSLNAQMLPNDVVVDSGDIVDGGGGGGGTSLTIALHMTILTPARKSVR